MSDRVIQRVVLWSVLGIGLGAFPGCNRTPEQILYKVNGRITLNGQPLTTGSVSLRPENSQITWHQPTGIVEPDGQYTMYTDGKPGAPPGAYKVVVFSTDAPAAEGSSPGLPKSQIPTRYNTLEQTPLRVLVVERPTAGVYDLELDAP